MAAGKTWQRLCVAALVLAGVSALAATSAFVAQRERFRQEINFKKETKLDQAGRYLSVLFDADVGKYDFQVSEPDRQRLSAYLGDFFATTDQNLLKTMVDALNTGHIIVFKEYHPDGVNLKTFFLSPKARYWEWLTDINGIENMFHVYNFSVGLGPNNPQGSYVLLQTQGTFFGITRAVTLPVFFWQDDATRTLNFRMPTQAAVTEAAQKMPALKPGRTDLDLKFMDYSRVHPFFQEKNARGEFVTSDQDIKEILHEVVLNMDEDCEVKETTGHWTIHEDYPYLVVDYSLKTRVNMAAFIPPALRFLAGTLEQAAQYISDEVSAKYLTLSMKNFRDLTQQWTAEGKQERH
ncbi:MAG: hypothetical protein A2V67_14025 [Deltaproteobacteria bacterium RBG_13_61_14]|nr:MAG: hypothetical protein A2V67_14025 [Deltaproteobacteria bacterium RBG_13_61_14]